MNPVGQFVEQPAHLIPVYLQPLFQARLDHLDLTTRPTHDALLLPQVQEQIYGVGIQLFPLFWQATPAPGVQAGHEGQKQGTFGQFVEAAVAQDSLAQQITSPLGIVTVQVAPPGNIPVPTINKGRDLSPAERGQNRFLKSGQSPGLFLVGISAAGDENTAQGKGVGHGFDDLFDVQTVFIRRGHFIQPIKEEQTPFFAQLLSD